MTENKNIEEFPEKPFNLAKEVFEWFYTILIALAIAFIIKGFFFDLVRVDGDSMYPTLHNNDRLIVRKIGYEPKAGDIVILDSNYKAREEYYDNIEESTGKEISSFSKFFKNFTVDDAYKKRYYVKRVIALPGQVVDIPGDGNVYVDGEMIDSSFCHTPTYSTDPTVEYPITVEDGNVFVLGDNRGNSTDSRASRLGQVPYESIMGKAVFRILPFDSIGTI